MPEFLEKKDILDDAWTSAAIEAYEFEQELLSQCCDEDDFIAMEDMAPTHCRDVRLNSSNIAHVMGVKMKLIHDRRIILTFVLCNQSIQLCYGHSYTGMSILLMTAVASSVIPHHCPYAFSSHHPAYRMVVPTLEPLPASQLKMESRLC